MEDKQKQILWNGVSRGTEKYAALNYTFTVHAGGDIDESGIGPGSCFEAVYSGSGRGICLALISHSGASRWSLTEADADSETPDGKRRALFRYESFFPAFGERFDLLDEIRCVCAGDREVTLYQITYLPGEGSVPVYGNGRWVRPDTGIAFIGDSITENIYYKMGDLNALFGRDDCVNYGIGAQTPEMCLKRSGEILARGYSCLAVWCGINAIGSSTPEEIAAVITELARRALRSASVKKMICISILPTCGSIYPDRQENIRAVNRLIRDWAEHTENAVFADIVPSFTDVTGTGRADLFSDGLHPNADGYALVKQILAPLLPPKR